MRILLTGVNHEWQEFKPFLINLTEIPSIGHYIDLGKRYAYVERVFHIPDTLNIGYAARLWVILSEGA